MFSVFHGSFQKLAPFREIRVRLGQKPEKAGVFGDFEG